MRTADVAWINSLRSVAPPVFSLMPDDVYMHEQIDLGHAELARAFWPRPNKFRRGEASGYVAHDASNEGSVGLTSLQR